jgi:2-polyprenyl-6-methoxyphenol hydroxylase-like FAD-dependent oxidoreductase
MQSHRTENSPSRKNGYSSMARVIIIGGGIGGLTTAIAFTRHGWDVSLHEAAPALRPIGQGIWVPINAMRVLARLDLAQQVSEAGWPLQSIELRTDSGMLLSSLNVAESAARHGHSIISIRRSGLVTILSDALQPGVLHLDSQLTHFTEEGSQVRAHFSDGSEEAADLLVGADGIHSRVRDQLFHAIPLRYSGQTCFRGIAELALPAHLASTCRENWGGKNRFGFSAVDPNHVYWFAPQSSPPGLKDPLDLRMQQLRAAYSSFPNPIPAILEASKPEDTLRTDLYDFPPIARWSRQNVVLIGDAAHAMTPNLGQGGGQAIEDAFVLAEQSSRDIPLQDALESYQNIRMGKVVNIVKTSWTLGKIAHWHNPVARAVRDFAIRLTPSSIKQKQLDDLANLNF